MILLMRNADKTFFKFYPLLDYEKEYPGEFKHKFFEKNAELYLQGVKLKRYFFFFTKWIDTDEIWKPKPFEFTIVLWEPTRKEINLLMHKL